MITVNLYYTGVNGNAKRFAEEMERSGTAVPVAEADTIFVGFPIWWYREPSIIDSFLDAYDFTGKID